jgi:hypothetical protein
MNQRLDLVAFLAFCGECLWEANSETGHNGRYSSLNWEGFMKKIHYLILAAVLLFPTWSAYAANPENRQYGDLNQEGSFWLDRNGQAWDLTRCDLTLTYKLDMSEHLPEGRQPEWTMVGIGSGAWAWMTSGAPTAAESNPQLHDIDDKLHLGSMPNKGDESNYDVLSPQQVVEPPIGAPWSNYGIWFDRDGVSKGQEKLWGMIDGVTYNTGGVYQVKLTFHAISQDLGTLFATVNGVQSGFYTEWRNTKPDYFPVGMSFTGNLSKIKIFASTWGENVKLSDLSASGCPVQ